MKPNTNVPRNNPVKVAAIWLAIPSRPKNAEVVSCRRPLRTMPGTTEAVENSS